MSSDRSEGNAKPVTLRQLKDLLLSGEKRSAFFTVFSRFVQPIQRFLRQSHDSSGEDHSENRSDADSDELPAKYESDGGGDRETDEIEEIFSESERFSALPADDFRQPVRRIRTDLHSYCHRRTDTGQKNCGG